MYLCHVNYLSFIFLIYRPHSDMCFVMTFNPLTHSGYYIYLYVTPNIPLKVQFCPHRTNRVLVYRYMFLTLSQERAIADVNSTY